MKVLLIKNIKFDLVHSRLGDRFLLKLNDLCDLTIYGSNPKELKRNLGEDKFKEFKLVEHKNEYKSKEMLRECGTPDVILCHQFSNTRSIMPGDLDTVKIPRAILLFDTYLNGGNTGNKSKISYVQEKKFDLVIRRGCQSFYENDMWKTPSVWLPFSVRAENYFTSPETRFLYGRLNKLTFVGGGYESKNQLYETLKLAVDTLKKGCDSFSYQGIVGVEAYPNAIKNCVAALSYTFEDYKGHPAKLFELLGSGTGVLTTPFTNKKELFGEEDVCWEFEPNCRDIVKIANRMLDSNERKELYRRTRNAVEVINSKHLDEHRIVELYNILEALAGGSQIPQLWE